MTTIHKIREELQEVEKLMMSINIKLIELVAFEETADQHYEKASKILSEVIKLLGDL